MFIKNAGPLLQRVLARQSHAESLASAASAAKDAEPGEAGSAVGDFIIHTHPDEIEPVCAAHHVHRTVKFAPV